MTSIALENGDLQRIYPLNMMIFQSYVKLPEGTPSHDHLLDGILDETGDIH